MKIYFGNAKYKRYCNATRCVNSWATWATDQLGLQASRSNIPIGFYADCRAAYISSILVLATMPTGRQGFQCLK